MTTPRTDLRLYLAHFRACVLQDALNEATASYWEHRALALEKACSRPGDRLGTHTTSQARRADDQALNADADACRDLATLAPLQSGPAPDVWAALAEAERQPEQPTRSQTGHDQPGHDWPDAA